MTILTDPTLATGATPIIIIHSARFDAYLAHADARTRAWITATEFRAKPHTHALVPASDGSIAQVLVGVKDAGDVYALSHLPLALPVGVYAISSHHDALDP